MSAATLIAPERETTGARKETTRKRRQSPKQDSTDRRGYGTGTLYTEVDAAGKQWWYGRWLNGKSRPNRKIGLVRKRGSLEGLTRTQAEKRLREMIQTEQPKHAGASVTIADGGERLLRALEAKGRKPTTLSTYSSTLRTHIQPPPLGDIELHEASSDDVEELLARMRRDGKAPKTIANTFKLLNQIFVFGKRKHWCKDNPCEFVDAPVVEPSTDIRFLDQAELSALLGAVDLGAQPFGRTDHALFLTAAMAGLRQGELLALRWRDVDWQAGKIRVRRNYVRGHWGTPKSRRGSRSVPLADQVAGELDRHFKRSAYQADDDLVFAHPEKGTVLKHSSLCKRFKKTLREAGVRPVRFHDLRHTFGTRMAAEGVAPRKLQEWMGHADLKTTQIYTDYEPDDDECKTVCEAFSGVKLGGFSLAAREPRPLG
jgi:integrase